MDCTIDLECSKCIIAIFFLDLTNISEYLFKNLKQLFCRHFENHAQIRVDLNFPKICYIIFLWPALLRILHEILYQNVNNPTKKSQYQDARTTEIKLVAQLKKGGKNIEKSIFMLNLGPWHRCNSKIYYKIIATSISYP